MKIKVSLGTNGGTLTVQYEKGDTKAKASGFTKHAHGWGAEIHLLGMIQKQLAKLGFNLIRAKIGLDGHLMGDDYMQYLRPSTTDLKKAKPTCPMIYIYDDQWQIRSSSEDFNQGNEVRFCVTGDICNNQPHWHNIVAQICGTHNIECQLTKELAHETV